MEQYRRNEQFKAASDHELLVEAGILEMMRTPGDGEDRNQWIEWDEARLVVTSFQEIDEQREVRHQIKVQNADGKGNSIAFATEEDSDGTINIATVSGWRPEGRAKLSEEQSAVFKSLAERSVESDSEFRG